MLSGRAMCRHLNASGVVVQKVVRKRDTGDYVADFFMPGMNEPIPHAKIHAQNIRRILPQARIIDTHNTIATWRSGEPVIYATVVFQLDNQDIA